MPLIAPDRIDRTPAPKRRQRGLTLVELTVTLLILTVLATIAIRSTNDLGFQVRYEQTKERLEMIRHAILGNPRLIINGQQAISGFVADMGRLPENLRELLQRYNCAEPIGAGPVNCTTPGSPEWVSSSNSLIHPGTSLRYGWNGPYLNISSNPDEYDAFSDGWGRTSDNGNYGWYFNDNEFQLEIQSAGKNHAFDSDDTEYDADYPNPASQPVIGGNDWLVNISGGISVSFLKPNNSEAEKSICMKIFFRKDVLVKHIVSKPLLIKEDGTHQTVLFNFDFDETKCKDNDGTWLNEVCHIPVGQNAIGIYEHVESTCTDTFYPTDRKQSVAVNFYPKAYLPVINW